ncbi:glucosamine-6-phosphate deaminase [Guptibacillus algicola]|uniref:glucosamine-6-phosphate deaminase n=1 Tax=Guptibacillus algicola TaxID=225844 RepID=UPI001CD59A63|nr:glucosamine-6-phosphate deaminase [Alkalihalobacillus algicola]MCA0988807.1 glucosamine-6-phosphate deaminase [Alkalihalobacillus algicola]
MRVIEAEDYQELSNLAADYFINKIKENPEITLGLATGGTPKGTYKKMVEDHAKHGTSYRRVTTFNLDEYVGLGSDHPNSYHQFMETHLFKDIDLPSTQKHLPNGIALDINKECIEYEQAIERSGGIDVQLLGLGSNGHIGFNEPGTAFETRTHVVELAPSTRQANARFFNHADEVPQRAITMGISTIMQSKEIVLLVSGESKHHALKELLIRQSDEGFPASVLTKHPHVTIIADRSALSGIPVNG